MDCQPKKNKETKINKTNKSGFTLVELAVVVVIIGVLAAFGVPRFMDAVERSKAAEAFGYLDAVRSGQERYHAREGIYAAHLTDLDVKFQSPKYFGVGDVSASETTWTLTLTRTGPSAGNGAYTVIFNQDGYDTSSGIQDKPNINPMGTQAATSSSGS